MKRVSLTAYFARTPRAGRRRDDMERGLRAFPCGKYMIYYRDTSKGIVVARVIHAARNQRSAFPVATSNHHRRYARN